MYVLSGSKNSGQHQCPPTTHIGNQLNAPTNGLGSTPGVAQVLQVKNIGLFRSASKLSEPKGCHLTACASFTATVTNAAGQPGVSTSICSKTCIWAN